MYIHRNFIHPGGVSPMKQEKVEEEKVEKKNVEEKVEEKEKTTAESIKEGAIGAWNMAGEAYKKIKEVPVIGDVVKHQEQKLSDVLAVASVPANIIAEAVEGLGGQGDKEFNISDAIPDLSGDRGSFNFKNMHGKDTKTVSAVTNIENPYLAFAVDLATDPSTYVGAGVVRSVAGKGIKTSTKALVKSSDSITNANKKQIIKAIDEGPTGPKAKGGVDGGNVVSKGADDVYYKDLSMRTVPVRGGKQFADPMGEYNSIKSMYNELPDNVVKPGNPVFDKAGNLTGYNMDKVKGVDLDTWMRDGNKLSKEMYDDMVTKITDLNNKGIYHGDLKINNIMIDESGTWKLIDPVGFKHASNMGDDMLKVAQEYDAKALKDLGKYVK